MYNQITITPTELIVSPAGLDRLWALKGAIRVPWRHVTGVFRDQGAFVYQRYNNDRAITAHVIEAALTVLKKATGVV